MKVLYITCGSGADPTVGGSLIRTMETARWVREKASVFFLTTSGGMAALRGIFAREPIFILKTPLLGSLRSGEYVLKQSFSYLVLLVQAIWRVPALPAADIFYTDSDGIWDVFPALLYKARYPRAKWVAMNHHLVGFRRESVTAFCFSLCNILLQKVSYFFLRRFADAAFVLDTEAGDEIRGVLQRRRPKFPVFSVRDGVEIDSIRRIAPPPRRFEACYFGGFRLGKGMDDIIPVWKMVCEEIPGAKLVLIGGMLGKFKTMLDREIRRCGLEDNVTITGYVPDKDEAIRMIKGCRIFISLSHEEGWGIAIMECLAAGLPGVLWNLPIFRRIIRKGVIKVEPFRRSLFADAVIRLLNSRELRLRLGEETWEAVRPYDWKTVAGEDFRLFGRIIEL